MAKKSWDSDWIHFSKRARKGIVVLLFVFVIVSISPRIYYNYFYTPPTHEVNSGKLFIDKKVAKEIAPEKKKSTRYHRPKSLFNPNDYSLEQWQSTGLSKKQAQSILNYLKSGATLRIKSDLKKLYVVDDELYQVLEPMVDLPERIEKVTTETQNYRKDEAPKTSYSQKDTSTWKKSNNKKVKEVKPVSVNTATAWDLKSIPGIGPYFAKEIIKKRDEYGGLISLDQLFDIYKLDKEKLDEISPYLIIDKTKIEPININLATQKEMSKHPLIDYNVAKSIVFHRENYGKFKRIDEVLLTPYIDRDDFERLKLYLTVE